MAGGEHLLLVGLLLSPAAVAARFTPLTRSDLRNAVNAWCANETIARGTYGNIVNWNVAQVTDMRLLFNDKYDFNSDISSWDVSHVTVMNHMFDNARSFNRDISSWDVSRVGEMYGMFNKAAAFNQDISRWNIANVHGSSDPMRHMFRDAEGLSECNRHRIHVAWAPMNSKWPYSDWSEIPLTRCCGEGLHCPS